MEVSGQLHAPAGLLLGKEPLVPIYPLDKRLGGPQSRFGRGGEEKNSQLLTGFEPPVNQPLAQRHTTEQTRRTIFRRYILILSLHLCLGLPNGLFPSGFPTKILYTHLFSPIRTTCTAHLNILHLITLIIFDEVYRL
jgi:hypothetical protein